MHLVINRDLVGLPDSKLPDAKGISLRGRHEVVWTGRDNVTKFCEIVVNGVLYRIYNSSQDTIEYS